MVRSVGVAIVLAVLAGAPAAEPAERAGKPGAAGEFTLGLVQRNLKAGLSQADLAERLGSPNIVARDAAGRETWIYDKVSTEVETTGSHLGVGGIGSAAGGSMGGLLGLAAGRHSEKARSSQKTLTVVVRFAADGTVESFTFHQSRF